MYQNLFPQLAHLFSANAGGPQPIQATPPMPTGGQQLGGAVAQPVQRGGIGDMMYRYPPNSIPSFIDDILRGGQLPPGVYPGNPGTGVPLPPFDPNNPEPGNGFNRPMPPSFNGMRPPGRGRPFQLPPGVKPEHPIAWYPGNVPGSNPEPGGGGMRPMPPPDALPPMQNLPGVPSNDLPMYPGTSGGKPPQGRPSLIRGPRPSQTGSNVSAAGFGGVPRVRY